MAKGYETHQLRLSLLQGLGKDLARRAKSKCELTGASGVPLRAYEVPPVAEDPELDRTLLLSEACHAAIQRPQSLDGREWRCLAEAVWSDFPALQVLAWRLLKQLAPREAWARELIDECMLDPEIEAWARAAEL
ncbi:MAG: phnA protein [Verrucomicrobia bacterium]|nr:phnA protein [Verrucomicrobiota bacterium]